MPVMASVSSAAAPAASVNPPDGPSTATNSNGTFCASVIMTCCSLAFGATVTSQTLVPATCRASRAAS